MFLTAAGAESDYSTSKKDQIKAVLISLFSGFGVSVSTSDIGVIVEALASRRRLDDRRASTDRSLLSEVKITTTTTLPSGTKAGPIEEQLSKSTAKEAMILSFSAVGITVTAVEVSAPPGGPPSVPSYAPSSPLIMSTTNVTNSSNLSNSSAELSDLSVDHAVSQEQRQIVLAISLSIVVVCCCVAALLGASCQKWASSRSKVAAVGVAPASPVLVGAIGAVRPSRAKEMAEAAFRMQQRPSPAVPSYGGLNWTPEMLEAARRLEVPGISYQP